MPRYIDADKALSFPLANGEYDHKNANEHFIYGCETYREWLEQLPTVSSDEVLGVVHCKDCKWCHAGYCEKYDDLIPFGCANKPWEDWFCADGKRREAKKEAQDAD